MNVFEDLVGSLKNDNLLEETVLQAQKTKNDDEFLGEISNEAHLLKKLPSFDAAGKPVESFENSFLKTELSVIPKKPEKSEALFDFSIKNPDVETAKPVDTVAPDLLGTADKPKIVGKDFYRKRAIEEVSGLQMVEHILSGVEREQNKSATKLYNDIAVKKALHDFLQISEDIKSPEHAQAEFHLMQETETWCSALSHRDKRISVAHLRRYCETTKPPLSSQALISLARFYRNLPFSEMVRSKFDLVVTRLFSKDMGGEKRTLAFSRNDLITHIAELYAEWSSVPLYSIEDDQSQIVLTALKFEDLITEAERADTFDELINTDFFNRLRLLKEESGDVFYVPLITATIIESNIRIGNKYVDLIDIERGKLNISRLQDKYGFLHDQAISDSTSKTLQLVELLKEKVKVEKDDKIKLPSNDKTAERKIAQKSKESVKKPKIEKQTKQETKSIPLKNIEKADGVFTNANRWLLAGTLLIVFTGFGLYFWSGSTGNKTAVSAKVKKVNLENSSLQQYLQTAQINGETFEGVTLPSWDALKTEKREELLKKIQSSGIDKGYTKVQLTNKEGKPVASATAEKAEVITP